MKHSITPPRNLYLYIVSHLCTFAACIIMAIPHVSCIVDADTPLFEEDEGIISFSYNSGFYPAPFSLTLRTSTQGTIYYTLDGSVPYENNVAATVYTTPIPVDDATSHENIWSMRSDTSYGYAYGVYELPQYAVDKCTVVKAAVRYADGSWSPVQTRSYFVCLQGRESLNGIGTISLSLNPESLFDYETGIYILGKTHDDNPSTLPYWWWTTANFRNRGKDWEREAFIQFFDAQGELQLSQPVGIRIKGGGSRGFAQKSFNLYARKKYSEETKKMKYDFFGTGIKHKRATLFTGGDDIISKSADYIVSIACATGKFSTFHFVPYAVFLNGEYWGMYWLTEKYDEHFIAKTYEVTEEDVVLIKGGKIEVGEDKDIALWNDMLTFITQNDMSYSENYEQAQKLIDIKSITEYYAAELYIGRYNDWSGIRGNAAQWRTKTEKLGYGDGRWRWMLFDVNSGAMEYYNTTFGADTFDATNVITNDALFSSLMQNKDFRIAFANALTTAATVWFPAQKMTALIDAYAQSYTSNLEASYKRWFGSSAPSGIDDTLAERKAFFAHRAEVVSAYRDSILAME